jgi:hypothetical protein
MLFHLFRFLLIILLFTLADRESGMVAARKRRKDARTLAGRLCALP